MATFARLAVAFKLVVGTAACCVACGAAFTTATDASSGSDASAEACGAAATCPELGWECGTDKDSCGNVIDCGSCKRANAVCGVDHACHCTAITCASLGAECGPIPDGCGGTESCGSCESGTCGGGGFLKCGSQPCVPKTCAQQGAECGDVGDGCGNVISCADTCISPLTCGGAGANNKCGCIPQTCASLGWGCGTGDDGCGGTLNCGGCEGGACHELSHTCSCVPTSTCASLGYTCGSFVNSCKTIERCGNQPIENGSKGGLCLARLRPKFFECPCASAGGGKDGSGGPLPIGADSGTLSCSGPTPPEPTWSCTASGPLTGAGAAQGWCCAPPL